VQKLTPTRG